MRWPFGAPPLVSVTRRFETRWARDCARIHAASFAKPWSAEDISQMSARQEILADVALNGPGNELLGFVMSRVSPPEGEVLTIAVGTAHQGQGVGRALLRDHLSRVSATGVRSFFLEVDEGNAAALKLYRGFGFVEVGTRAGYYAKPDGSRATALVLRAELD